MFNSILTDPTHVAFEVQETQFLTNALGSGDRRAQGRFNNDMMKLGDE